MWYIDIIGIIIALMGVAIFVYVINMIRLSNYRNIALSLIFLFVAFMCIIVGTMLIFLT